MSDNGSTGQSKNISPAKQKAPAPNPQNTVSGGVTAQAPGANSSTNPATTPPGPEPAPQPGQAAMKKVKVDGDKKKPPEPKKPKKAQDQDEDKSPPQNLDELTNQMLRINTRSREIISVGKGISAIGSLTWSGLKKLKNKLTSEDEPDSPEDKNADKSVAEPSSSKNSPTGPQQTTATSSPTTMNSPQTSGATATTNSPQAPETTVAANSTQPANPAQSPDVTATADQPQSPDAPAAADPSSTPDPTMAASPTPSPDASLTPTPDSAVAMSLATSPDPTATMASGPQLSDVTPQSPTVTQMLMDNTEYSSCANAHNAQASELDQPVAPAATQLMGQN